MMDFVFRMMDFALKMMNLMQTARLLFEHPAGGATYLAHFR